MLSLPPAHLLPPTPVLSLSRLSAGSICVYMPCMQRHLFRPAVHLKLAPPLPGGCLLSCSYPSLQSLYIMYIPLYIHVIIFVQQLLVHPYCTTTAPLLRHCVVSCSIYVAPLASSPWNPPTQVYAHPPCAYCAHSRRHPETCLVPTTELSWHHSLPHCGTRPLKYMHTHRVPTAHTLVGILKLAMCTLLNHYVVSCGTQLSWHHSLPCRGTRPLKYMHTYSVCPLCTLSKAF